MKKGWKSRKVKEELQYTSFIIPLLIGYLIFFIIPVIISFRDSFTNITKYNQLSGYHFTGLKNYINIFTNTKLLSGIGVSFKYALGMLVFQNLFAIPLAVVLTRNIRSRNLLRAIFFAPATLSTLVVGYLWGFMMASTDYGVLNKLLGFVGLGPVNWLGDYKLALVSILVTQIWQWTGWAMVIYISNLQSIPDELYEAATVDGASGIQSFFRITLPLLQPGVAINIVVGLVSGLKVFDIIYSLTKGGPGNATQSMITNMLRIGFTEGNYGGAAAYGIIFLAIVLLLTQGVMKILNKWEESIS